MNKTATLPSKKRFVTVKNDKNLPCRSVEIGLQAHMSAMIQSGRRSRFHTAVMCLYHCTDTVVALQYRLENIMAALSGDCHVVDFLMK